MSIQNGYQYSFNQDGSSVGGSVASGVASNSVTLPLGCETILLACTANCHFRISAAASTALSTDPILIFQQGPLVIKLPNSTTAWVLSAIQDSAAGLLYWVKVAEA